MDFIMSLFIFLMLGILFLFIGIYNIFRYKSFEGKPKVIGKMLTFKRWKTTELPIITYVVDGVEYQIMGKGFFDYGKEVDVYYEPTNPANAVMAGKKGYGILILGLGFLAFSLFFLIYIFVIGV